MMNFKRLIQGILLSFVFLLILSSIMFGADWFLKNKDPEILLASVSGAVKTESAQPANNDIPNDIPIDNATKAPIPYRDWQIKDIEVLAQSAISVESDLSSEDKILFKKEGDKKLPIASLTKLMTAMVTLENYDLTDSVKDLLYVMLISSSNQAALALSEIKGEENFVGLMNEQAKKLGLENTNFSDPTGLSSQNYSTVEDLVKLTEYLLKNYPIITEISRTKEYGQLKNTNELLGEIPDIIGGKTGFTTDAKGCLILVMNNHRDGNYLIYVILGADDRFGEMKKLINWVNSAYIWQ